MPIAIDDIVIRDGRREVDPGVVKRLADSIENVGLRHPITVRKKGEQYILVAGRHRIEAFKKLDREHIPSCIVSMTNAEARMWEIAENLHRAELNKLDRANQIKEWVALCEQERKKDITAPRAEKSMGRPEGGVAAASRELGMAESTVREAVDIAGISPDVQEEIVKAGLDNSQTALRIIARQAPENQTAKVRELAQPKTDDDVIEQQFTALMSAWNRASPEARQRFREAIDEPLMDRRFA